MPEADPLHELGPSDGETLAAANGAGDGLGAGEGVAEEPVLGDRSEEDADEVSDGPRQGRDDDVAVAHEVGDVGGDAPAVDVTDRDEAALAAADPSREDLEEGP